MAAGRAASRLGAITDDMLDVIIDQNTPIYGHLARLYERLIGFPTPPIVRGVGLTPIPRPERLYFWFGDPIDTTRLSVQSALVKPSGLRLLTAWSWGLASDHSL